jgi:hypothetical protein
MNEPDDGLKDRLRAGLEKMLREAEQFIVDTQSFAENRPDWAPRIAPDQFIDVYRNRDWARGALAALDAGEPIPPAPWDRPDPGEEE